MIAHMLVQIMGASPIRVTPSITTPTIATLAAGACSGHTVSPSASIRVTWTVANADDTHYSTKVYFSDAGGGFILQITQASSVVTFDMLVDGERENGTVHDFTSNWIFRVDVARKSDGLVVSTKTSAAWQKAYGHCL